MFVDQPSSRRSRVALYGSGLTATATGGARRFLDLRERVLDMPRLQVFGDRHRWNVKPRADNQRRHGATGTNFSALKGRCSGEGIKG